PRLEAELIAMLSRPSTHLHSGPASAADRALVASVFGLLGAMLGVIGLAAVLWLNQLNGNVARQAAALSELDKAVRDSADRQRIPLDAVARDAEGKSPGFMARLALAVRERDDARDKLAVQTHNNELLAAHSKELTETLGKFKAGFDEQRKRADLSEKDAKEA